MAHTLREYFKYVWGSSTPGVLPKQKEAEKIDIRNRKDAYNLEFVGPSGINALITGNTFDEYCNNGMLGANKNLEPKGITTIQLRNATDEPGYLVKELSVFNA